MNITHLKGNVTVAVGLSGGVDSAMAAYLLKRQGYDVVGLTMKIWPGGGMPAAKGKSGCYGPDAESVAAAAEICRRLAIPHHVIDLVQDYEQNVLEDFSRQYMAGFTPNPCVLCNQFVKFGALLDHARSSGIRFDKFATGHYARVEWDAVNGRYALRKAADKRKDQTYFLYRLQQKQLAQVIFPLGGLTKQQVREMAAQADFADLANKPESQDFIDGGDFQAFFGEMPAKPGRIVDVNGKELGRHSGVHHYTVGQRKGLRIGGTAEPLYVAHIDATSGDITAAPRAWLATTELTAGMLNWVAVEPPQAEMRAAARVRSRQEESPCSLAPEANGNIRVVFENAQYAAAPGQSVVFYEKDTLLGGGIIRTVHSEG